jgi:hypothetical protein
MLSGAITAFLPIAGRIFTHKGKERLNRQGKCNKINLWVCLKKFGAKYFDGNTSFPNMLLTRAISGRCEIIEDYPDDKYGPSCLILGFTKAGRPFHLQCSYPSRPLIKIITIYEPDPDLWVNFRVRKK